MYIFRRPPGTKIKTGRAQSGNHCPDPDEAVGLDPEHGGMEKQLNSGYRRWANEELLVV